jgi:transposase
LPPRKVTAKNTEELLLELREENIHLKTHQLELEEEVKM